MRLRPLVFLLGLAPAACADPCIDDGFDQDPKDGNCPGFGPSDDGGSSSAGSSSSGSSSESTSAPAESSESSSSTAPVHETEESTTAGADSSSESGGPSPLAVSIAPACGTADGQAIVLTATATGGTGSYLYSWTPTEGLDDPASATPSATADDFVTYTVTVDDGEGEASASVTLVDDAPFDLQANCTLYQGDFLGSPASITYQAAGTIACETGNNDFGLHLCEGAVFGDVRLEGVLGVSDAGDDDDIIGLVWGAQDNASFYALSWKRGEQVLFDCTLPAGIVVKRIEAPELAALEGADVFCPDDTARSTLLLAPAETTTAGWEPGESYTVAIEYRATGSSITVVRDGDDVEIAAFEIADETFPSGAFGSMTYSQQNACVGPLVATCL